MNAMYLDQLRYLYQNSGEFRLSWNFLGFGLFLTLLGYLERKFPRFFAKFPNYTYYWSLDKTKKSGYHWSLFNFAGEKAAKKMIKNQGKLLYIMAGFFVYLAFFGFARFVLNDV